MPKFDTNDLYGTTRIIRGNQHGQWVPKPAPARYQHDIVAWATERMDVAPYTLDWSLIPQYAEHRWDGTPNPFMAIAHSVEAGKDTGISSGTGTGKTFFGALLTLWFLDCFEDSLVVTTAPKKEQLTLHIWKEIGRLWQRFVKLQKGADKVELRARLKPGSEDQEVWAAVGYACGVDADADFATRAQGFHAEHMLIMCEETPGIHPAIMLTLENTCVSDHNIRVCWGNPDSMVDTLAIFQKSPTTNAIRISALDHPNVVCNNPSIVKGAVGRQKVIDRKRRYYSIGKPELYHSRVRGVAPEQPANALIKRAWCVAAAKKWGEAIYRLGKPAMGVDVAASEHGDLGAISVWQGNQCDEVRSFPCPDPTELGLKIRNEMRALGVAQEHVGIDCVGVGAGTIGRLKEANIYVIPLNGGIPTEDDDDVKFNNSRSKWYWRFAVALRLGEITIPYDEVLFEDLCCLTYEPKNGRICVETKEVVRSRIQRSTDKGDAVIYGFVVRDNSTISSDLKPVLETDEVIVANLMHEMAMIDADPEYVRPGDEYGDPLDQA